jgi:hypothetical protein
LLPSGDAKEASTQLATKRASAAMPEGMRGTRVELWQPRD